MVVSPFSVVEISGALFVGATLFWYVMARRNGVFINSSLTARSARMGSLITRSILRKSWLRMRQSLATRERRKQLAEQYHIKTAAEVSAVMGNMKGLFMKLGQILSFADASIPEHAQSLMQGLQQSAPPMDYWLVRQVIRDELGADPRELFSRIDESPLAAASIGQVHRARLPDGTRVVLKVQYPGIDTAIENDLKVSSGLSTLFSSFFPNADSEAILTELKARLLEELDYGHELKNQQLFYDIWNGHPYIRIPRVFAEFSSKKVLCQEYVRGFTFYEFLKQSSPRERRLAVHVLNDFVFDSMHLHKVFNGDPHPGNYLFDADGSIIFLDFGCIKHFSHQFLSNLQTMNRALMEKDRESFDRMMYAMDIILPGRPYERDRLWEFFSYPAAPFLEDRIFSFTPEWVAQAREMMSYSNIKLLNLPSDLVFFNRITFGLNAIFQKLGASENFSRHSRRYLYPEEKVPPSLASLGISLPKRFM